MGRASRKEKKKGKEAKKKKGDEDDMSIPGLVARAEECVATYDFDGALVLYQKALESNADNAPILDAVGELLLELGEHEKAKAVLIRSVQIEPTGSFGTYMYLGQLMSGTDAVACFDRGAELLLKEIEQSQDAANTQMLRRKLSCAMCSRGEVYMTDLCDHPQAESECARSLEAAVQHDPSNPDAWVAKGNFHICQQNAPEALQCLDKASELIDAIEDDDELPPFEVRLTVGKMYVELAEHAKVVEVLEDLLAEDDEHIEVLFMLGSAYKELGDGSAAKDCADRASLLYSKLPPEARDGIVENKLGQLVSLLANA